MQLRECDDFIPFLLLLRCQALCPKIVIFFGPFFSRKKKKSRIFLLPQRCPPFHLETIEFVLSAASRPILYPLPFLFPPLTLLTLSLGRNEKIPFLVFFFSLFFYIKKLAWR